MVLRQSNLSLVVVYSLILVWGTTTAATTTTTTTTKISGLVDLSVTGGALPTPKHLRTVTTPTNQQPQSHQRDLQSPQRIRLNVPECSFRVSQQCLVHGDDLPASGVDCETFVPSLRVVESCQATPYTTTLLYNGGSCEQTDNAQVLGIVCQDGPGGDDTSLASHFEASTTTSTVSPPVQEGAESYIIVTDALNLGIVYHTGLVKVGSQYTLQSGSGNTANQLMEYGFLIRIYDGNDPTLLLQQVAYYSPLCSSQLEAANRFGASQIVQYTNAPQGRVSLFKSYQINVQLDVSFALTGRLHTAAVDSITFMTNFAGFMDFTPQVQGKMIEPGRPVTVTLDVDGVDLYEKQRHTVLAQISVGGSYCMGTDFLTFTTGAATAPQGSRRRVYA